MTPIRAAALAILLLAASVLQAQSVESTQVGETRNVSRYGDRIYFAGQPSRQDLERFRELGVRTVINLRTSEEMDALDFDEASAVREAGLDYLHVPMRGALPSDADLEKIFTALSRAAAGGRMVLMHCASSNRVGAVWSAFRHAREGLGLEDSLAEGQKAGLRSARLKEEIKKRYGQ